MIVLDSDLLIDLSRKAEPTLSFVRGLHDAGEVLATTSVNAAEFLRGGQGNVATSAFRLRMLEAFVQVPFGPRAARRFARLMHGLDRAGARISSVDGMIAAATLEEGARLATRNVRDFARVPGLEVLVPDGP